MKLGEIKVDLLDHMSSDLGIVNAARCSFDKESKWVETCRCGVIYDSENNKWTGCGADQRSCPNWVTRTLSAADKKLISYLAKHNHWSPFSHAFMSFRIKAPMFVARQLQKHQVGLAWNEVSRRYVDSDPEFYVPEVWRKRADNVKQGSSEEAVAISGYSGSGVFDDLEHQLSSTTALSLNTYQELLDANVCPEQARMVLPQSTMTEWHWSGSLYAFARVCKLRLDPHAQKETQLVAKQIATLAEPLFPHSWAALMEN